MAVIARRQPSSPVSTGLAAVTVALSVAGAAADAVPIAKQILNSAAHISAVAEKIQKKREALYTLIEKADIYATQIDIAVAGRVLDASLQRRLHRLYSVFLKIEALVDVKAGVKNHALTRVLQNFITKPNRAETLVVELEREIQLFQLLTGIQLSLIVGETARAVVADMKYDGQFRVLRDCDIDKRDIIERCDTEQGTVVWASARVDGQLMVIRYLDPSPLPQRDNDIVSEVAAWRRAPYHEYLENVVKVSTVRASHPHVVQLYGLHIQGPAAVFRSGTFTLSDYLTNLRLKEGNDESVAVKYLRLVYKMLDASAHLADVHGLRWAGGTAIVDDNGEPRIGLFDDIVRADPDHLPNVLPVYWDIFFWFNTQYSEETGVVEQVHDSSLHTVITEHLRDGSDTDYLQQVWDAILQEQLHVECRKFVFPIISGNLSLSQELIARARSYFETNTKEDDPYWACEVSFVRHVLAGGANITSRIYMSIRRSDGNNDRTEVDVRRSDGDDYRLEVDDCTHDDSHIRYKWFRIHIPAGFSHLADIAQAAGLPADFETSWDGSPLDIGMQMRHRGQGDESSDSELL